MPENVNIGSAPNDGTGDPLRVAFGKLNANFNEVITEMRAGRVSVIEGTDSPSGSNVNTNVRLVITCQFSSNTVRSWRPIKAPTPPTETDAVKLDANGRWWQRVRDSAIGTSIRDAGILPTTNLGGTGDAITADLALSITDAGVTSLGGSSEIEYIPAATNSVANPTITIGGTTYQIRNADGGEWPAAGFVVGRSYKLRRNAATLRVTGGAVTLTEIAGIYSTLSSMLGDAISIARQPAVAAPGDDFSIVDGPNGSALVMRPDGVLRGSFLVRDIIDMADYSAALGVPGAPGDYIVPVIVDLEGKTILGINVNDGTLWPSGGGGGSSVTFVDPDNQGDAWNSIQTEDNHGTVIRYMSRQWRETWGFEKRGSITLAQTPDPAIGILHFGGGSAAVVRPLADDFPFHIVNEQLIRPEDGLAASAAAAAWLEGEYAIRRGLPTVIALTQVLSSAVESDAAAGSPARNALRAKVIAARDAIAGWGKDLFVDRIGLALLEGAPTTGQATADLHYAAVGASMRAEIAEAAGQVPMPVLVVSQSAGTRTSGTSPVILAEGNLDWAHWSLGFIVATPKYPFPLQAGSPAALTPAGAMQVSELEALAVTERLAARDWYGPTIGAQATRSGAVITVPFTAMSDLMLRNPAQHGFAVDGVTNGATISSVAVSGRNVLITMSAAPAGTLSVRYAFGETGDRGDGYSANRGSLTDSWSQPSRMVSGATLYRYARSGRANVV